MSRKIGGADEIAFRQAFGERLRGIRKQNGLTHAALAAKLGLQQLAVQRYEAGDRTPDIFLLKRLAEELKCDLHLLICGDSYTKS